jgi:hypothetical protein
MQSTAVSNWNRRSSLADQSTALTPGQSAIYHLRDYCGSGTGCGSFAETTGTDCINVYDGLSRDFYFAILDEAKKLDLPVVGHLPNAISVREASEAGQRSLKHGIALAGGSTVEGDYIKRRLDHSAFQEAIRTKNFGLIPAKIARDNTMILDTFNQERADAIYRLLAKNNTFITSTLVTERSLTFIDDLSARPDPRMQYVSPEELEWWKPENCMLTKYRTPEYSSAFLAPVVGMRYTRRT